MTLLETSIILSRGNNTHSQLQYIVSQKGELEYVELLNRLETIYSSEDTPEMREKLKQFLAEFSEDIYQLATKNCDCYCHDSYDLKV